MSLKNAFGSTEVQHAPLQAAPLGRGARALRSTGGRWLPWVVSAGLLAIPLATQDPGQVAQAFARADLVLFLLWLTLFAVSTLLVEAAFWWLSFRWLAGVGTFWGLLQARGASYLLSLVHAFLGLGGLVLYVKRRYGVSARRGSGIALNELLHEVGSLGALALLASWWVEGLAPQLGPRLEAVSRFGAIAFTFFLACFLLSRLGRLPRADPAAERLLDVFPDQTLAQACVLFGLKMVQNLIHGLFVLGAMASFGILSPKLLAFALAQIVRSVRGLPVSAFGIGVDQLTFPALFSPWELSSGQLLAFSLAYTFSLILTRGLLGGLLLRGALAALKERSP